MNTAVATLFETFGTAEGLSSALQTSTLQPPQWRHAELVGRLVELSGQSALTVAMGAVLNAQRLGEPVAWVSAGGPLFYPPDVAEGGVDLTALIVVRVQGCEAAARASDKLLRSGAFGLIVLDLGARVDVSMGLQARLAKLAMKHAAVALVVTEQQEKTGQGTALSSLVSLRCTARRKWIAGDRYRCQIQAVKDKRRGPAWSDEEELRAPAGVG